MTNFRDIENLSAYLDGQLDEKKSTEIESRLKSDPELESALQELRFARTVLRRLPARKAPRNFTLTRQMAGLKPPLPRSYPLVRFATVLAAILFLFSFTANTLAPMVSFGAAAPAPIGGMGGGGADTQAPAEETLMQESAATEEAFTAQMAPAATEAPPTELTPLPADTEGARIGEPTPSLKEGADQPSAQDSAPETADQPEVATEPPLSANWTVIFFILSVAGGIVMRIMRRNAKRKWR
ncbi:MAG: hypothetical protein DCC59_02630 [Chloroflexi bacterium]|nr:hypothetical protein [Chloroflexi bacterium CFX1]MCK6568393.1 hypothetical protein [Anaerolineales bacterium]MCQ3953150.1 hypothetical protein [Chloroflexota bacterium]MDL1919532.1 hypothetical protein [Chloroflexi bacterium CFX5]NUQ58174.1 hypothetical protein [Anaerolineales bacterium]